MPAGPGPHPRPPVLSGRALNRALLERQLLTGRAPLDPEAAIEHLAGLQSQNPGSAYVTLWTRLAGFDPEALSAALADRRVVRLLTMRGTIHLLTARDALAWRPTLQPVLDRALGGALGRAIAHLDLAALTAEARERIEAEPQTYAALGAALQAGHPGPTTEELGRVARVALPLVQLPPRGLWRRSGPSTHTTIEAWLGRPLDDPGVSPDTLLLRYLAAFGPASVADAQAWSGLTRLRAAAERLRPELRVFRDEDGRELLDLPDAPRPDPATPVPVRFLADFDNVLIGHADRRRIVPEEHRREVMTFNGIGIPSVLVDGGVRASWKVDGAALRVTTYGRPLSKRHRAAVTAEGRRLLAFLEPGAAPSTRDVIIAP